MYKRVKKKTAGGGLLGGAKSKQLLCCAAAAERWSQLERYTSTALCLVHIILVAASTTTADKS